MTLEVTADYMLTGKITDFVQIPVLLTTTFHQ